MVGSLKNDECWRIQLCETLAKWSYLHHIGFGRSVYHTFIRLVGPKNEVLQEIHGGAALLEDGLAQRITTQNFLRAAARSVLMNGSLPPFALLARIYNGEYRSVLYMHNIVMGSEGPLLKRWANVLELTRAFNEQSTVAYDSRKMNCNSLTHTLARAVTGVLPERKAYAPGFENPVQIEQAATPVQESIAAPDDLHRRIAALTHAINRPFAPDSV